MRRDRASSVGVAPIETVEGELDLRELGRALWRKKRWIIVPTLIAFFAALVVVNLLTPLYRSEARVLIENRETAYNRPEPDRGTAPDRTLVDAEAVQSQVQIIQSRDLARKVMVALKLNETAEFTADSQLRIVLRSILALTGLTREPSQASIEERALGRYYERLSVYQVEKSRVIGIDFQSRDPQLAAEVANEIAKEYLVIQQAAKRDAMRQSSQWLLQEIEELRGKVADAEAKAESFRSRSNLYVGNNNNQLSSQTLGELNTQIVTARAHKADFEARARLIRAMLKSGKPIEFSEILNSDLIRRLSEQRANLRAQLAEQSSTLLPLHPRIKELRAQIASLDGQIRIEAEKLARALENDTRLADAKLANLLGSLDQMKQQQSALGGQDVQLRALEREAKSQRDLLESYLARYRDAAAREAPGAVPPDARVVSQAVASSTAHFPKKLPIVLVASLAMAMLCTALIAMGELLGGGVYRQNAAAVAGPPVNPAAPFTVETPAVAMPPVSMPPVPMPSAPAPVAMAAAEPQAGPATQPEAEMAPPEVELASEAIPEPEAELEKAATEPRPEAEPEAIATPASEAERAAAERRLAELVEQMRGSGPGIFLIARASNEMHSGRVAVHLARDLAAGGARALFLDLDAEGTPAAALLADPRLPGLADLLSNSINFAEVIHRDLASRIHVISLGRGVSNSEQLLAAERLAIVLGALSQTYEYVVVATPVLSGLRGAERLARFARGTTLIATAGTEAAAEAQSRILAEQGFTNVTVVAVGPEANGTSGLFAA